jgi:hypothetical protein
MPPSGFTMLYSIGRDEQNWKSTDKDKTEFFIQNKHYNPMTAINTFEMPIYIIQRTARLTAQNSNRRGDF